MAGGMLVIARYGARPLKKLLTFLSYARLNRMRKKLAVVTHLFRALFVQKNALLIPGLLD